MKDVKYLKVYGAMNDDDWTTLSLMDSVIVMDLGDATATIITTNKFNKKCSFLKTLILPQGLTEIERGAFMYTNISKITFPSSLRIIREDVFWFCGNLDNVVLPDSMDYIGGDAFRDCTKLRTIQLPKNLSIIRANCFKYCSNLEVCSLPAGLKEIREEAFYQCKKLNTRIPNTVNYINYRAFYECAIDSVILPEGVDLGQGYSAGVNTFQYCNNLVYVEFPTSFYWSSDSPIRNCI